MRFCFENSVIFFRREPFPLRLYFAPMEGVTDAPFRRVHHDCFGGVDKYFIPFISPTQHLTLTSREQRAVSPAENAGINAVPQVLTRDPAHFRWAAQALADLGYTEVNLNLGCPSGTVTAKGKGSGLLRDPDALRALLDGVFADAPLPVSVKTRIGFDSPDEWPALLALFCAYPICELTIHARTRSQFYRGEPFRGAFAASSALPFPVVLNGDLFSPDDCRQAGEDFPFAGGLMLGRGLVANPALARTVRGGPPLAEDEMRRFHDALFDAYRRCYQDGVTLGRMREWWNHAACCFQDPARPLKAIRKAKTASAYLDAASDLLSHSLTADPHYSPF